MNAFVVFLNIYVTSPTVVLCGQEGGQIPEAERFPFDVVF